MNYLKNDVILVRYPFSDFSITKIRPAIIVITKKEMVRLFLRM